MNKKVPIIIAVILFVIGIILYFVFRETKQEEVKSDINYLVIGNESIWENKNNSWKKVTYDDVNNKKLNVYIDNMYSGKYTLKYGKVWNLYDNSGLVMYEDSFVAMSDVNWDIVNINIDSISKEDLIYINSVLNSKYSLEDITLNEKVNVDLNNNGIIDTIINVGNLNRDGLDKYFSLVYVLIDGKKEILINEDIDVKDNLNYPIYRINSLLRKNGLINIILHKGYFSEAGTNGNSMYEIIDGKYELAIED